MPFPFNKAQVSKMLLNNAYRYILDQNGSSISVSGSRSISQADILDIFYAGAREINPDVSEISSEEMHSLWLEYLELLPVESSDLAQQLSFLVINMPQVVKSEKLDFLSALESSLLANASYWTAIQHRSKSATTADMRSRSLEIVDVTTTDDEITFSAANLEKKDISQFYNSWISTEESKHDSSEFEKFVPDIPGPWANPNHLMSFGVKYVDKFRRDFLRLWENPQVRLIVTAGGVSPVKMLSLLNEVYIQCLARYITAKYEKRETETEVFHLSVVNILLRCGQGFAARFEASIEEVLKQYVEHIENNLSFGIADVFTRQDKSIQREIFPTHTAIQSSPKDQGDALRPLVGLEDGQSLGPVFPSNISLSSRQFQSVPEEHENEALPSAASALIEAAQGAAAQLDDEEMSVSSESISEHYFKYDDIAVGDSQSSAASIVQHFLNSNKKYFSRIDRDVCPSRIIECVEHRLLRACISDPRCSEQVRDTLFLSPDSPVWIKEYIFSERLKKAVTMSSDSESSHEAIKFSEALESVAISLMSGSQTAALTAQQVQEALEQRYKDSALIQTTLARDDKLSALENLYNEESRAQVEQGRKVMLNTFVPLCLAQVTKVGDVGRMFNRGKMHLDKLAVPASLLQHFSRMQNYIDNVVHNDEQALENMLLSFAKETFDLLLNDFERLFPDPNVFLPFIEQMTDFPKGASPIEKRNILICQVMALQLSHLINQFSEAKTLNGQLCSIIAGRVSNFLALDTNPALLERPDFYQAFKENTTALFQNQDKAIIYGVFRLGQDENEQQLTFSSVALKSATDNQLDLPNAAQTLSELLALRGAISEDLLVKSIASLWVKTATQLPGEDAHHFRDALVDIIEDNELLGKVHDEALYQARFNVQRSASNNIVAVVLPKINARDSSVLRESIIRAVTENIENTDIIEKALMSEVGLRTLRGQKKFSEAARNNDDIELLRLADLLQKAGSYKARLLAALDNYKDNANVRFPEYIEGYLEEKLNSLGDFGGKEPIRKILRSDLPVLVKLEILGQIGQAKAAYNPLWRGRRGAVQNFYEALSQFVGVIESNIETKFKSFRHTIVAPDVDDSSEKIERDLQRQVLRESNQDKDATFVKQFERWVQFSNISKFPVVAADLSSIKDRPTIQEMQTCVALFQDVARLPEVPVNPSENDRVVHDSSSSPVIAVAKDDSVIQSSKERALEIGKALEAIVKQDSFSPAKPGEEVTPNQSTEKVKKYIDSVMLEQLANALDKFSGFYVSPLSIFGKHHAPAGMQKIIDMIRQKKEVMQKSQEEILNELKSLAAEKIKDFKSYGTSLGLSRRSAETQEAYEVMNQILEKFTSNNALSTETDSLVMPSRPVESNTEIMRELTEALNKIHEASQKKLESGKSVSEIVQIKMMR